MWFYGRAACLACSVPSKHLCKKESSLLSFSWILLPIIRMSLITQFATIKSFRASRILFWKIPLDTFKPYNVPCVVKSLEALPNSKRQNAEAKSTSVVHQSFDISRKMSSKTGNVKHSRSDILLNGVRLKQMRSSQDVSSPSPLESLRIYFS